MLLCIIVSLQAVPILPQARIGVPRLEQPQCCSPDPLGTQVDDYGDEGGNDDGDYGDGDDGGDEGGDGDDAAVDDDGEEKEDLNDICTVTCI